MSKADLLALTGRLFMASLFLASAFGKITNFEGTTGYMSAHGLPSVGLLCASAILLEVAGGLCLILGYHCRLGAAALTLYMVPATLVFHGSPEQRIQLLKNMAVMGGLMQVLAFGPGEISLDQRTR